jgi:hypothetical protein
VGRIHQQTFIDTYSKVVLAKLYDRKTPVTSADLLNDRVIPLFEEHEIPLQRMLTDRGTEYCGNPEHHESTTKSDLIRVVGVTVKRRCRLLSRVSRWPRRR